MFEQTLNTHTTLGIKVSKVQVLKKGCIAMVCECAQGGGCLHVGGIKKGF